MSAFESMSITGRIYGADQERAVRTHNGEIPARIMDALDSYFITRIGA
jgi:hypothetical protein